MSGPDRAGATAGAEAAAVRFLSAVLPREGPYFIAVPLPKRGYKHYACATAAEAARLAVDLDSQGQTVYFALASFKLPYVDTPQPDGKTKRQYRVKPNVRALRALWFDLDCGAGKGFESQAAAVDALIAFCETTRLSRPLCVLSGQGVHAYFPLCEAVPLNAWQPVADKLKALAHQLEFPIDPVRTADPTSVLRPAGTTHRKDPNDPHPVEVINWDAKPVSFEEFSAAIEAACAQRAVSTPRRREPQHDKVNEQFAIARDFPPCSAHKVAERCQQLRQMRDTKGQIKEPHWYHGLQLIQHSVEGDALAHEWSSGHPSYSREETERKLAQIRNLNLGPTLCTKFADVNPGGCDGCPFKGKISSPVQLGVDVGTPSAKASPPVLPTLAIQPPSIPGAPNPSQTGFGGTAIQSVIILPSDHFSFSQSAQTIFPRLAATGWYYSRSGELVRLAETKYGLALEQISAPEFRSLIEKLDCPVMSYIRADDGSLALKNKLFSKDSADALLESAEARALVPAIRLVSCSPVLVASASSAKVLGPGYHQIAGGVLVTGPAQPTQVGVTEAASALKALLTDFDFASRGDEARALAGMITPALRMGGLLLDNPNGVAHCPVIVVEADESQAGKGYIQRLIRSIYNERGYPIAQREGGVGSLDESIGQALLSGQPFVNLDNVRGRIDSKFLESILTNDGITSVRVPHRGEVQVDTRAVLFQLTSNGVDMTPDLANRSMIIRIRKRPDGYRFRAWQEGGLIAHVWDRSGYYLSCVFAVVSHWISAGRPTLDSGGFHDFREWAGALGWIIAKVFGGAPLLEEHRSAQKRVSNPALTWLRLVCLAAERARRLDQELSASAIAELCENEDVDLPGLRPPAEDDQARKQVGKLFARCFREVTTSAGFLEIEGFRVVRTEHEERNLQRQTVTVRRYRILRTVRTD